MASTVPPLAVSAAARIAGRPVEISCQQLQPPLAGTLIGDNIILLDLEVCAQLRRYISSGATDRSTAAAVLILTHEAVHASGVVYETDTECAASRLAPQTARLLGHAATRRLRHLIAQAHQALRATPGYGDHPC